MKIKPNNHFSEYSMYDSSCKVYLFKHLRILLRCSGLQLHIIITICFWASSRWSCRFYHENETMNLSIWRSYTNNYMHIALLNNSNLNNLNRVNAVVCIESRMHMVSSHMFTSKLLLVLELLHKFTYYYDIKHTF